MVFMMLVWGLIFVVFVFFFFKQKTSYEMRISDWSSDVCSSDLAPENPWATGFVAVDRRGRAVACNVTQNDIFGSGRVAPGTGILLAPAPGPAEIGRASCRERVWPSGLISGGALVIKKKQQGIRTRRRKLNHNKGHGTHTQ